MKTLVVSPAAETDINDIWDYSVDTWGIDQADHYINRLRDACYALANGRQGRKADVRPGYLKFSIGSHVIYYRETGDRLDIVRILHGRMDVDRHL